MSFSVGTGMRTQYEDTQHDVMNNFELFFMMILLLQFQMDTVNMCQRHTTTSMSMASQQPQKKFILLVKH